MSEEQKVLTKEIAVQFLKEKGVSIPKEDEVAAPAGPYNYISRKNGKTYFLRRRTLKSEGKPDTVLHYFSEQGGPVGDLAGDSQPDEVLNAMPEKYTVGENDDTGLPMLMQKSTEPVDTAKYTSIDEAAAKLLALHWKEGLNLNGLKEISPQVAAILAQSQGVFLRLKSLTNMDQSVAAALAAYKGELYLDGLTELSDAAASAFSAWSRLYPGRSYFFCNSSSFILPRFVPSIICTSSATVSAPLFRASPALLAPSATPRIAPRIPRVIISSSGSTLDSSIFLVRSDAITYPFCIRRSIFASSLLNRWSMWSTNLSISA